jgi:hypothetical protein
VIVAGVGQPVGVLGLIFRLVIRPVVTSSASRFGVRRVFSGVGPAPEIPGMVETRVFPRITQKAGFLPERRGAPLRNGMSTARIIFCPSGLKISPSHFIIL